MAGSLQDQLIKAGLATPAQAKKAEREKRAQQHQGKKQQKKGGKPDKKPNDEARKRAQAQLAEKKRRDKEAARAINQKAAEKALRAEIKQIILKNDLRAKDAKEDDMQDKA